MPEALPALSDNVRAEMARHRITQTELAQALELSQSAVSRRLKGESEWTASEVMRLAQLFGIDPGRLFDSVRPAA